MSLQSETFGYDSLDRLTSVSGPYSASYAYSPIGNITSMNGVGYTYGSQPHAVTDVGETEYAYDANGNMTDRDDQTITWDVENRPVSVSDGVDTSTFVYDGDGSRALKTEGGETVLYINTYYEKNLTTDVVTSSYYLGGRLIAQMEDDGEDTTLRYVHQDSLSSTSVMSADDGTLDSSMTFYPFGSARSGSVNTDKQFTGQRLDGTGLYYYGARYYDPLIGRFINADIIAPDYNNPQSLNRYSYCFNNPLRYTDPSGNWPWDTVLNWVQTALDVVGMIPVVGEIADAVNGVIYTARGDVANAALSFAACVPVAGIAATGAKWVKRGIDVVDKVDDVIDAARAVDKIDDVADTIRATNRARELGTIGENASGIVKNTERITSPTGVKNYRVPDGLSTEIKVISEVKNVRYQGYTHQLNDYRLWARNEGFTFELWTRPDTRFSSRLQSYINSGDIVPRTFNP